MSVVHAWCSWLGIALVVAGSAIAWRSLLRTWREHTREPLVPLAARIHRKARSLLARLFPALRKTYPVTGSAPTSRTVFSGGGSASGDVSIPEDAPVEEKVALLIQRVEYCRGDIRAEREQRLEGDKLLDSRMAQFRRDNSTQHSALSAETRGVAIGEVRRQLVALLLIAAGTILLAVPTLFPGA